LILRLLKLLMIALLTGLGLILQLGWPWFTGVAIAAALFAWQQYQVRNRDRNACFEAFLNNNWVGVVIWAGLLGTYILS
jgi:4-hydroxybenzoate polyprenyltransferase